MAGYEHSQPYDAGLLSVSDVHRIHYEQYGRHDGKSVIFLHGGPGGATSISNTKFFDPAIYRVILLDQRGCGKSQPTAELRENTTQYLIADVEALRTHLKIEKWFMVFGGSWGSTLSLIYAQSHPERASSLVLRGIYLAQRSEMNYSRLQFEMGSARFFPEAADELLSHFTPAEQKDWVAAAYQRLRFGDRADRLRIARACNTYDLKRGALYFDSESLKKLDDEEWSIHHALILLHYVMHGAFIRDGQILEAGEIAKIRHIPCTIIQGRYDAICPPISAWELHKALPDSKFVLVPDAGHNATEPGTFKELVAACDEYGKQDLS